MPPKTPTRPWQEIYFGREVPDVVTRYESFRRVIGVGEGLIHERAEKTHLDHVFPTINSPNLDQVVGGIGGRESFGGPGGEFGIEQGYVPIEIELAIRAFRAPLNKARMSSSVAASSPTKRASPTFSVVVNETPAALIPVISLT